MTPTLDRLLDNPMFFKDITQWLRNRTFTALFFGLLLVANALTFGVVLASNEAKPGNILFNALFALLMIYLVVVGTLGRRSATAECHSATLETYKIAGMNSVHILNGKLLSLLYQYAFGFFCVVPFMFFAYFLGGLDVVMLFVVMGVGIAVALPYLLGELLGAFVHRDKVSGPAELIIGNTLRVVVGLTVFVPLALYWKPITTFLQKWVSAVLLGSGISLGFGLLVAIVYLVGLGILYYTCYEELSIKLGFEEEL